MLIEFRYPSIHSLILGLWGFRLLESNDLLSSADMPDNIFVHIGIHLTSDTEYTYAEAKHKQKIAELSTL